MLCLLVVGIQRKLMDLRQIGDPVIAHLICHPLSQQRIAVEQEPSLCDTVCLVVEFLRHHLIEIFQFLIL